MKKFGPDLIIALGGGSPIDAAKAMWLFYENPGICFEDLRMRFMDIRKRIVRFPELGRKAKLIAIPPRAAPGSKRLHFLFRRDGRPKPSTKYPLADYTTAPPCHHGPQQPSPAAVRDTEPGPGRPGPRPRGLCVGARLRLHRSACPQGDPARLRISSQTFPEQNNLPRPRKMHTMPQPSPAWPSPTPFSVNHGLAFPEATFPLSPRPGPMPWS